MKSPGSSSWADDDWNDSLRRVPELSSSTTSWADDNWNETLSQIPELSSVDTSWADDGWNDSLTQIQINPRNVQITSHLSSQSIHNRISTRHSSSVQHPCTSTSNVTTEQQTQIDDIWLQPTQIALESDNDSSSSSSSDWDEPIYCSTPVKSQQCLRTPFEDSARGRIDLDYSLGRRCTVTDHDIWSQETRIPTPEESSDSQFLSSAVQENTRLHTGQVVELLNNEDRSSLAVESPPPQLNRRKGPIQYSVTSSPLADYPSLPFNVHDEDDTIINVLSSESLSPVINTRRKRSGVIPYLESPSPVNYHESPDSPSPVTNSRIRRNRGVIHYSESSSPTSYSHESPESLSPVVSRRKRSGGVILCSESPSPVSGSPESVYSVINIRRRRRNGQLIHSSESPSSVSGSPESVSPVINIRRRRRNGEVILSSESPSPVSYDGSPETPSPVVKIRRRRNGGPIHYSESPSPVGFHHRSSESPSPIFRGRRRGGEVIRDSEPPSPVHASTSTIYDEETETDLTSLESLLPLPKKRRRPIIYSQSPSPG